MSHSKERPLFHRMHRVLFLFSWSGTSTVSSGAPWYVLRWGAQALHSALYLLWPACATETWLSMSKSPRASCLPQCLSCSERLSSYPHINIFNLFFSYTDSSILQLCLTHVDFVLKSQGTFAREGNEFPSHRTSFCLLESPGLRSAEGEEVSLSVPVLTGRVPVFVCACVDAQLHQSLFCCCDWTR